MTKFVLILWVVWVLSHADEESKSENIYNRPYDD